MQQPSQNKLNQDKFVDENNNNLIAMSSTVTSNPTADAIVGAVDKAINKTEISSPQTTKKREC